MNIHHLELFYYVARYGGITQAVRNIPYGIQQPAVSGQVGQLEEFLGVTLFQRRPFALTPAGEKLFAFISPFFSNLDALAAELQGGKARQIQLGASPIVLRDHMPEFLRNIQTKNPSLKVGLKDGTPAMLEALVERDEIDMAVTALEKTPAPGIQWLPLIDLPLVLLVPASSRIKDVQQLWSQDRIQEPLICLPPTELLCKHFQQGLSRLGVDWFTSIEVGSVDLVQTYVENGFGIGVSVRLPESRPVKSMRLLPLDPSQFPPIKMGVLWRGKATPLLESLMQELQAEAKRLALR